MDLSIPLIFKIIYSNFYCRNSENKLGTYICKFLNFLLQVWSRKTKKKKNFTKLFEYYLKNIKLQ